MKARDVYDLTNYYAEEFIKAYDMKLIIREFVKHYKLKNVAVFDYLGWLPFGEYTSLEDIRNMKTWDTEIPIVKKARPNYRYRYNIGVLSISHGYLDEMTPQEAGEQLILHYLAYILDNKTKEIWLFDSLSSDPANEEITGFANFARAIYPKYEIRGMQICSGCVYEPVQDVEMHNQNIFCHTWSLYFIFMVLKGLKSKQTIEQTIEKLNRTCGTPQYNLRKVKQFAYFIVKEFTEFPLSEDFLTIFIPETGMLEELSPLLESPEF